MSEEMDSNEQSNPRLCGQCGKRMPSQTRGRPRRWCSQQCRQLAYEERHGLESWKDNQPKVNDLSEVVEVMQERAAKRLVARGRVAQTHSPEHSWGSCVGVVCSDQAYMRMVLDAVCDLIDDDKILDNLDGRFLAGGIARLVDTVLPGVIQPPASNAR